MSKSYFNIEAKISSDFQMEESSKKVIYSLTSKINTDNITFSGDTVTISGDRSSEITENKLLPS